MLKIMEALNNIGIANKSCNKATLMLVGDEYTTVVQQLLHIYSPHACTLIFEMGICNSKVCFEGGGTASNHLEK